MFVAATSDVSAYVFNALGYLPDMDRKHAWCTGLGLKYGGFKHNLNVAPGPVRWRVGEGRLHPSRAGEESRCRFRSPIAEASGKDGRLATGRIDHPGDENVILRSR